MLSLHLSPYEVDILERCLLLSPSVMRLVLLRPVALEPLPEDGLDDVMIVSHPNEEFHRLLLLDLGFKVSIARIDCLAQCQHEVVLRCR